MTKLHVVRIYQEDILGKEKLSILKKNKGPQGGLACELQYIADEMLAPEYGKHTLPDFNTDTDIRAVVKRGI